MKDYFIPVEEARDIKRLGFNEPCFRVYDGASCLYFSRNSEMGYILNSNLSIAATAPSFYQAFRWFREKFGLNSCIMHHKSPSGFYYSFLIGNAEHFKGKSYKETELILP